MERAFIERWIDTLWFAVAVGLSGALLIPVLLLGLVVSAGMLGTAVLEQTAELAGAVVVVLSLGGAVGIVGLLRAHRAVRRVATHNVTATMLCLAIGAATALAVAAIMLVPSITLLSSPWGSPLDAWPALIAVVANAVWVLFGIAWMQRLARRYAEDVGRPFDGSPVAALSIAIALAIAVVLIAVAL